MWDISLQCNSVIQAGGANVTVINKENNEALFIAIAVPADTRIAEKG